MFIMLLAISSLLVASSVMAVPCQLKWGEWFSWKIFQNLKQLFKDASCVEQINNNVD